MSCHTCCRKSEAFDNFGCPIAALIKVGGSKKFVSSIKKKTRANQEKWMRFPCSAPPNCPKSVYRIITPKWLLPSVIERSDLSVFWKCTYVDPDNTLWFLFGALLITLGNNFWLFFWCFDEKYIFRTIQGRWSRKSHSFFLISSRFFYGRNKPFWPPHFNKGHNGALRIVKRP